MHVLIVDDDEATAYLERRSLQRAGHRITIALTTAQAWGCLETDMPDALILDYQLADQTGIDFYRAAAARGYHMPAVIVTGMERPSLVEEALAVGIDQIVIKKLDYVASLPSALLEAANPSVA